MKDIYRNNVRLLLTIRAHLLIESWACTSFVFMNMVTIEIFKGNKLLFSFIVLILLWLQRTFSNNVKKKSFNLIANGQKKKKKVKLARVVTQFLHELINRKTTWFHNVYLNYSKYLINLLSITSVIPE